MGCSASSKHRPPHGLSSSEAAEVRTEADEFRARLMREVMGKRMQYNEPMRISNQSTGIAEYSTPPRVTPSLTKSTTSLSRAMTASWRTSCYNPLARRSKHSEEEPLSATSFGSSSAAASLAMEAQARSSHPPPLRLNSHVTRDSFLARTALSGSSNDLTVTVPGKVGCEDEAVVVGGKTMQHMLLRTRRVHKSKRGGKQTLIKRSQKDLEESIKQTSPDSSMRVEEASTHHAALSEDERRSITKVLQKHFLFAPLQPEEHSMLITQMIRLEKLKDDIVCRKGEKGDACYVILTGVCSVVADNTTQVAQLEKGHTFGELAMLYDVPRTATVRCVSPRVVLCMIRGPSVRRCLACFKERMINKTLSFLSNHEIFSKLMIEEKRMFANALSPQAFDSGSVLIDENISSSADWLFLVQEGMVEVTDQYKNRTVLGEGATISGQRMPYGQKVVVATALSNVKCLAIGHTVLKKLFGNIGEVLRRSTICSFLKSVKVFHELTAKQQMTVAALFQDQPFRKGDVIVTTYADPQLVIVMEGEVAIVDNCSTIHEGVEEARHRETVEDTQNFDSVLCTPPEKDCDPEVELPHSVSKTTFRHEKNPPPKVEKMLERGEVFGEATFRENCTMNQSLVARTDAVVCRAGHDEVCRALRGYAEKTPPLTWILLRNRVKECLQAVFPFSALYEEMLDYVVDKFDMEEYEFEDKIVKTGELSNRFYLVVEGEVLLRRSAEQAETLGKLRSAEQAETLGKLKSFGARQLLLGVAVDTDVSAGSSGCTLATIHHDKFVEACGVLYEELSTKMRLSDMHFDQKDVFFRGMLGQGQFGIVRRVGLKTMPGADFALKRIGKQKVIDLDQQGPIRLEREILSECCHPLIVRLVSTFQDEHSVYVLMENLMGGDLFTAMRDIGNLNEEHTLFFGASIVLAIEYLHSRGIMYRDLKPENIMLDSQGYLKLIDMGCCSKKHRSYTFIGTPEYLAPEVIMGKSYGKGVDWWSVGVIMYEMMCGPLPFGESCTDTLDVFRDVLEKPLSIPTRVAPEASELLVSLLERSPEQRLGSSTYFWKNEVREHPFFEHLNWDQILKKTTPPPYAPPCCDNIKPVEVWNESSVTDSDIVEPFGDLDDEDSPPLPPGAGADLSCFEGF